MTLRSDFSQKICLVWIDHHGYAQLSTHTYHWPQILYGWGDQERCGNGKLVVDCNGIGWYFELMKCRVPLIYVVPRTWSCNENRLRTLLGVARDKVVLYGLLEFCPSLMCTAVHVVNDTLLWDTVDHIGDYSPKSELERFLDVVQGGRYPTELGTSRSSVSK